MTKKEARLEALKKRDMIPGKKREEYSRIIEGLIYERPEYEQAENVFLYASFRSEADTKGLIKTVIKDKGAVFLPRVIDKTRMAFFKVESLDELQKSSLGIPEPGPFAEECTKPGLFIIPLAAFSKKLDRAGYGGGYYDRYLKDFKGRVPVFAMAFFEQLIPGFETDENDIRPDLIITQAGVISKETDADRILREKRN